jgi:membrane protein
MRGASLLVSRGTEPQFRTMIAREGQPVRGRRGGARRAMAASFGFARYALHRFNADGCFAASGALSYTTLVSLVPLAVLALGSLSAFPIFAPVRAGLLAMLFGTFVPSVGEQAAFWFRNFADSATQTTAIGFAGIATTGVLVLVTVEDQLNLIWGVKRARPWAQRVLAYWTFITLGPLLIGISLTLSTYLEVAARETGFGARALGWFAGDWLHWLARGLPPMLEFFALSLLYWLIPNCSVRWRDSAFGALVATVAIEVLKIGFSIYIGAASYYRTVYGTLAAIPIFLLWMYISWAAVLLGAVGAAAAPNWHGEEQPGESASSGALVGLSLALVAALARAQRRGTTMTDQALAAELGVSAATIGGHMQPLAVAGVATRTQEGSWVLMRSPQTLTLHDLYEALRLPLAKGWEARAAAPWQRQVGPAMERVVKAEKAALQIKVATLLGETITPTARHHRRWHAARPLAEDVTPE